MKPERTLQKMYDEYPKLYPIRQRALDHLFCTVGNGYSWYKGEVVHDGELFIWDNENEEFIIDPDYKIDEKPDIISTPPKTEEEYIEEIEEWRMLLAKLRHRHYPEMPVEEHYKELEHNFHKWYPLSKEYSLIYTVPDDVTPEWKALVEECKELLRKDGIDI